jgi:hypothetical protein
VSAGATKIRRAQQQLNIAALERLTRDSLKGVDVVASSIAMLRNGTISPTEQKSLKSLSWQITANVATNSGVSAGTLAIIRPTLTWL